MNLREIERKFLVSTAPDYSAGDGDCIEQGYCAIADLQYAVRLRKRADAFFVSIKQGQGLERLETMVELAEEQFYELWPLTEGRRLTKTRYAVSFDDYTVDLDVYHGTLEGFMTAEVEFVSRAEADRFDPPSWFGREVTDDPRYTNEALARDGLPDAE